MLYSPPTRLLNLTVLLPLYPPKDGFLDLVTSLRFIKALIQLLCTAVRIDTQRGWGKSLSMGLIKARHQRSLWSKSAMGSLRICLTFQPVERGLNRKCEKKELYINTEQLLSSECHNPLLQFVI